jgi:hypothetical protein
MVGCKCFSSIDAFNRGVGLRLMTRVRPPTPGERVKIIYFRTGSRSVTYVTYVTYVQYVHPLWKVPCSGALGPDSGRRFPPTSQSPTVCWQGQIPQRSTVLHQQQHRGNSQAVHVLAHLFYGIQAKRCPIPFHGPLGARQCDHAPPTPLRLLARRQVSARLHVPYLSTSEALLLPGLLVRTTTCSKLSTTTATPQPYSVPGSREKFPGSRQKFPRFPNFGEL